MCLDCYGLNFYCLDDWPDSVCHFCTCLNWQRWDQKQLKLSVGCCVFSPRVLQERFPWEHDTHFSQPACASKRMVEIHCFRDGALSEFMEIQSHCNAKRHKYSQCKVGVCSSVSSVCPVCMWTVACVCACVGPVLYIVDRSSCETLKNLMAWGRNALLSLSATGCCPCRCSFASTWCFTVKEEFFHRCTNPSRIISHS